MLILSNVLALALIVADEPRSAKTPPAIGLGEFKVQVVADGPGSAQEPAVVVTGELTGTITPLATWNLTLPEAIRIGLENSEVVRVITPGVHGRPAGVVPPGEVPGVVIAPLDHDASTWNVQAAVMAHVRSIEQQYWTLSHLQVAIWAREVAVKQCEEVLARERADLESSRGPATDFNEVEKQLEAFKLKLASALSDRDATGKQLRNMLGLPEADDRRIVAATPPAETRVEPDWESSLREMIASQPDIAQQAAIVRAAELRLILARSQPLPTLSLNDRRRIEELDRASVGGVDVSAILGRPVPQPEPEPTGQSAVPAVWTSGGTFSMPLGFRPSLANARQAHYQLLRRRATLQQITDQTTHSLAQFFLEVDAKHKQYTTARRLKVAARRRLEAQRAFYEEGRIIVDRLLDAIAQQADAIAQESQHLASYNGSLAAFEEAKGTLLAYDGVALTEGHRPIQVVDIKDDLLTPAAFQEPAEAPAPAAPKSGVRTFKLKAKLGPGGLDLDVEVRQEADAKPTP